MTYEWYFFFWVLQRIMNRIGVDLHSMKIDTCSVSIFIFPISFFRATEPAPRSSPSCSEKHCSCLSVTESLLSWTSVRVLFLCLCFFYCTCSVWCMMKYVRKEFVLDMTGMKMNGINLQPWIVVVPSVKIVNMEITLKNLCMTEIKQ